MYVYIHFKVDEKLDNNFIFYISRFSDLFKRAY